METEVSKPGRRGRKRKNQDVQNVTGDGKGKKRAAETRSKALIGRYVRKEFEGSGVFLGKISYYYSGLYRVDYEDGDCEDLDSNEVREVIVEEDCSFDDVWLERKRKLEELLWKKEGLVNDKQVENVFEVGVSDYRVENVVEVEVNDKRMENVIEVEVNDKQMENVVESVSVVGGRVEEGSLLSELSNGGGGDVVDDGVKVEEGDDADSCSESCEDSSADVEAPPLVPPPQLPPSSGNIGVPEEYVSNLFSVYGFLRSFSIQLYLSPFGLDDFVGSLNCSEPNTLLDSIHVALMRELRLHFEMLSSDGSELASKCLRCMDWSLLDMLTWPVYLVQYLIVLGYTDSAEWKEFYIHTVEKEYYTLSIGRKLLILQLLCDDVLDSEELRAEVDIREESEVGLDSDAATIVAPESKLKRVHPRYSKTSACKDHKTMDIIAENNEGSSSCKLSSLGFKAAGFDAGADVDQDGNNDECRLCGMDGTLLCCDGCPSAYHTRCIGVMKTSIPEGVWYCPECAINRIGPTIMRGTSLRGAEIFGVDSYGQVFLGTCNHLLVLKVLTNIEPCCKYYYQNDIPRVLQALNSSVQHIAMYSEICNGILQHWEILDIFAHTDTAEMATKLTNGKKGSECYPPLLTQMGKQCHNVSEVVESEHFASCVTGSILENASFSCLDNDCKEPEPNKISMDRMTHLEYYVQQTGDTTVKQDDCLPLDTIRPGQIKFEHTMSAGSVGQQAYPSDLIQQSLADKSSLIENAICTSANSNDRYRGQMNDMHFAAKMPSEREEATDRLGQRGYNISAGGCLYMGSSFKPQSYINNYVQGDFSASAAANLAVLSSEENRISESHAVDNRRKLMSANVSFQVKAFSSTAIRFFWPNTEKKHVDIPRERCSWCLSCKAAVTSKRGCLLNAAASNAIKGAMKILSDLRPPKNLDGSLSGIATYLMLMEKSLRGLTIGRFLSAAYREQWLKQVEEATTLGAIKILLLEFDENIRTIALSADWVKLVDNWSVESSATQSVTSAAGSTQKRGPGRPGRKPSATSEVTSDDCQDILSDFIWWRGGMLSKLIIQKGTLPRFVVKKVARHGGSRKITGIHYTEGSEIPKRSRQLVWRAAVEMSKTASQLALQVRYLDLHVRWNDLIRPEQSDGERRSTSHSLEDGKGPESEASAFRNASICDKKIVENKIRYGVAFGNQKHLPSRVMKNIIEVEQSHDGKEKYWFFETRIPLYLIKEYEERMLKVYLPPSDKTTSVLSKLQRRQLKASRKDIFTYLSLKRDNLDKCLCASCQLDVLLGIAVKCSACQGYCHERCTLSSIAIINDEVEFVITCKQCYHTKAPGQTENSNESPTSPLLLQGQEFRNAKTVTKGRQVGYSPSIASAGTLELYSEAKPTTHDSSLASKNKRKLCSWGLIWKKKNCEDTGIDFRLQNILLRGNPDMNWSEPECLLCHKPYNSDLMYIRCETCKHWYHAEAVELEESKIFDVVGFKCCKCRRIRSPACPYYNPADSKKLLEGKKQRQRAPKQLVSGLDVDSEITSEQVKEGLRTTPVSRMVEVAHKPDDNPLSLSRVDQFTEHNSEVDFEWNAAPTSNNGPQKLPVRRHVKHVKDLDCSLANNTTQAEISTPIEGNIFNTAEESLLPQVEWDASTNGFEDNMMFDYECLNYDDMGFEPQTYFSFTELLASDDVGPLDGVDPSRDATGTGENLSAFSNDGIPDATYDQQEPTISLEYAVDIMPCEICSLTEPCPDISCQTCGLWIHNHCLPWSEQSSWEDGWRCGNCRERQ